MEGNQALSDSLAVLEVIGKSTGKEDSNHCSLFRLLKVFHEKTKKDEPA